MISQITDAGSKPAKRARSQPASVCPARCNTPPGCAMSGKICPGWTISAGLACAATAVWMVCARSAAEIPVVMPSAASIDKVKFVPCCAPLASTINGKFNCWQRSRLKVRQTRPRACVIMKLISSGRTWVAAMTKSPSFSRSSSSMRMTIFPARISATSSSTVLSGINLHLLICLKRHWMREMHSLTVFYLFCLCLSFSLRDLWLYTVSSGLERGENKDLQRCCRLFRQLRWNAKSVKNKIVLDIGIIVLILAFTWTDLGFGKGKT